MVKGIKTSGKVVYVTAIFPFMALIGLFIMSLTLQGSSEGIKYFFDPTVSFKCLARLCKGGLEQNYKNTTRNVTSNWDQLKNPYCWLEAASQIFYSLSLGFGSCIAFASYNPTKTDFYKQTIGISIVNSLSSMLAGVTIFAIIGSSAVKNQIPIDEVLDWRLLLYRRPLPPPQLPLSGVQCSSSCCSCWELTHSLLVLSMMTALDDTTLVPKRIPRPAVIAGFCGISFLLGIPFVMSNGLYIVDLFDNFSANFPLMMVAFCEVTAVSWVYGINRVDKGFRYENDYREIVCGTEVFELNFSQPYILPNCL
eukprot:sb/3467141/